MVKVNVFVHFCFSLMVYEVKFLVNIFLRNPLANSVTILHFMEQACDYKHICSFPLFCWSYNSDIHINILIYFEHPVPDIGN